MSNDLTVAVETYRWPEKVLNALCHVSLALNLPFTRLDVDDVLRAAQKATGLSEFGEDDRWLVWLRRVVAELEAAGVTPLARAFGRGILYKGVVNRLKLRDYQRRHPDVLDVEVKRPIFIVGFPRTGTTVLQNLLQLHPDRRALEFWEAITPIPQGDDRDADTARRIRAADRIVKLSYVVAPEQETVHEIGATTPEEDWPLIANTNAVLNYDFQLGRPSYGDALFEEDMGWVYREFKEFLQVILHHRPVDQLVLKCPEHLWFLDALLEVFPDACIVWTHRDPYPTIASYCSMMSMNRRVYYGSFRPSDLGPYLSERFHLGIERALAVRARVGDDRFLDIPFLDTVEDPHGTVRRICERFDLDPGEDLDAQVDAWLGSGRKDKRGKHVYDGERYGLVREDVLEAWGDYVERFEVPVDR